MVYTCNSRVDNSNYMRLGLAVGVGIFSSMFAAGSVVGLARRGKYNPELWLARYIPFDSSGRDYPLGDNQ